MSLLSTGGYSAKVDLQLRVNGEVLEVTQTGPDRIILRHARELKAEPAELVISVDGESTTYQIMLNPVSGVASKEVAYW